MRTRNSIKAATSVFCALALSAGAALADTKIGVASATQNQVFRNAQPLATGGGVFQNERVRTGEASMAQLLFLDQTSLSIGPKSEVKLDRFVYDPSRGKGSVVINAGLGVFRFVSGSQNSSSYQIKTPVATIGVRGTMLDIISTATWTAVIQIFGSSFIGTIVLSPGQALIIYANGNTEGPFIFDGVNLNVLYNALSSPLPGWWEFMDARTFLLNAIDNSFTPPQQQY